MRISDTPWAEKSLDIISHLDGWKIWREKDFLSGKYKRLRIIKDGKYSLSFTKSRKFVNVVFAFHPGLDVERYRNPPQNKISYHHDTSTSIFVEAIKERLIPKVIKITNDLIEENKIV